jgi:hypothetical protein
MIGNITIYGTEVATLAIRIVLSHHISLKTPIGKKIGRLRLSRHGEKNGQCHQGVEFGQTLHLHKIYSRFPKMIPDFYTLLLFIERKIRTNPPVSITLSAAGTSRVFVGKQEVGRERDLKP